MQPADRTSSRRDELVMTSRQEAEDLWSLVRKPTRTRQGIIETIHQHPRRYENTAARDTNSTIKAVCVRMVETGGAEETIDGATFRRVLRGGVVAYNAHDLDAFRSFVAPDFVGVDHRPVSLGTFNADDFIAFTESLFAQVRTQHLAVTPIEISGNVGLLRTLETAETLDGDEVSFETLMVAVVVEGKTRRQDVFAPEAEADARALFKDLAARHAGAAHATALRQWTRPDRRKT
jgi:hypothetical protein